MYRVSVEEAFQAIDENIKCKNESIQLSIEEALGYVSAKDIYSPIDVPDFPKSPLDGFALRAEDMGENKKFKIIDSIPAGHLSQKDLNPGEAIRIMTGAPIPSGANTVVRLEDCTEEKDYFVTSKIQKAFENYIPLGDDIKKLSLIIEKGQRLTPIDLGVLASCGIDKIEVYRPIKITFISTGDEIVDHRKEKTFGKIYDSNRVTLVSRLKSLGFDNIESSLVDDDFYKIKEKISQADKSSDLIITTGGVSVGDKDYMGKINLELGGEFIFNKCQMKPGSHLYLSKLESSYLLALSGNPFAAYATFELFGRRILSILTGDETIKMKEGQAVLQGAFDKKSKTRRFIRAKLNLNQVSITENNDSGCLFSKLDYNCLIDIEAGNMGLRNEDIVKIFY